MVEAMSARSAFELMFAMRSRSGLSGSIPFASIACSSIHEA